MLMRVMNQLATAMLWLSSHALMWLVRDWVEIAGTWGRGTALEEGVEDEVSGIFQRLKVVLCSDVGV